MLVVDASYKFTSDLNIIERRIKMNGNSGIVPTVDLATNNNAYPVYPMMGGFGNSGFGNGFGNDALWIIVLLALFGWGNNGNNGGFFGGNRGFDDGYAWLSNGQKEIMTNTNNGFDTLHLSNQVEGIRDGINGISNAICSSTASINSNVSNGFYTAEISANNRQVADMQQNFNNQIATLQGFNTLGSQLAQCCCDNRLATCQTQNIVQNEGNATRFADANNTRDIITNATANTQAILDKLCQLELDGVKAQLDAKNDRIADLQREISMKDLQASQVAQTAQLRLSEEQQFDNFYNRLKNCPVNAVSVYGNQPVFTCPNSNGCGCSGYNQFI